MPANLGDRMSDSGRRAIDELAHPTPRVRSLLNQLEQARWRTPITGGKLRGVDHAISADNTKTRNDIGRERERGVFHEVWREKWNVRVLTLTLRRVYSGHF